jgi:hypothetical protein
VSLGRPGSYLEAWTSQCARGAFFTHDQAGVTAILKIERRQLWTNGPRESIPSALITLGTYNNGSVGCKGTYEQPNVRITRKVDSTCLVLNMPTYVCNTYACRVACSSSAQAMKCRVYRPQAQMADGGCVYV